MTVEEATFKILQEDKSFGMSVNELVNKVYDLVHREDPDKDRCSVHVEVIDALKRGREAKKIKETTTGFYCWNR